MLPESTRAALQETIEKLEHNRGLVLTLALSYGGRAEIVDAARRIARDSLEGRIGPEDITEERFREFLYQPDLPDPDLLIRTSGELRVSNFLLWQIAYAEIYVTDVFWPDFKEKHLLDGIREYTRRERRYGLAS
jgi:undecaprenyl diphosphate synthase